jgi:hypothetical protein
MTNHTHVGPRGGCYRVKNGRKVYDLPYSRDLLELTPTGSALLEEADDAPAKSSNDLEALLCAVFVGGHLVWWAYCIASGTGWGHGWLLPLQAVFMSALAVLVLAISHPLWAVFFTLTAVFIWQYTK